MIEMEELESIKKAILSFIEKEREGLLLLFELSRAQYEAIEEGDPERCIHLVKERERVGDEILSSLKGREEKERELATKLGLDHKGIRREEIFDRLGSKELKERWDEVVNLASKIRGMDEKNEEWMIKRMGEIDEKLASIKKTRRLRERYSLRKGESLYINRSL